MKLTAPQLRWLREMPCEDVFVRAFTNAIRTVRALEAKGLVFCTIKKRVWKLTPEGRTALKNESETS